MCVSRSTREFVLLIVFHFQIHITSRSTQSSCEFAREIRDRVEEIPSVSFHREWSSNDGQISDVRRYEYKSLKILYKYNVPWATETRLRWHTAISRNIPLSQVVLVRFC
mgnify:CR=1 FL=1